MRLTKKQWSLIISLVLTITISLLSRYDVISDNTLVSEPAVELSYYRVLSYADGDTIRVNYNGTPETVRFIGVDTPETHDPRKAPQCGGAEASAYTKSQIISTKQVRLEKDGLTKDRDKYNRLLRYVYLSDGTLLNKSIISSGNGFAYTYFPFSQSAVFLQEEQQAQSAKKGLWSFCTPIPNANGGYTSNSL